MTNGELCPSCGSDRVYFRGLVIGQITCRDCGTEGPEGTRDVASAGWANMPRRYTMSSKLPTVPGWYFTCQDGHKEELSITRLSAGAIKAIHHAARSGKTSELWGGPIPAPQFEQPKE